MSFTTHDVETELEIQMDRASSEGVVMLCSSHDEGSRVVDVWPAAHKTTLKLVIAACNEYGKLIRDIKEDECQPQYDYKVEGVDVPAGAIPFLDSSDSISGSSVATALVAGLSALILSCHRLAHPDTPNQEGRIEILEKYLNMMSSKPDSKSRFNFLFLERFANIDRMIKEGEDVEATSVLEKTFGMKEGSEPVNYEREWSRAGGHLSFLFTRSLQGEEGCDKFWGQSGPR